MPGEHDEYRELAVKVGELNATLRLFVTNQDRVNTQVAEATNQTASILASQGERLSVCESNSNCVPDIYEKLNQLARNLAYATGALAVLIFAVQVAANLGGPIIKLIKG